MTALARILGSLGEPGLRGEPQVHLGDSASACVRRSSSLAWTLGPGAFRGRSTHNICAWATMCLKLGSRAVTLSRGWFLHLPLGDLGQISPL